MNGIYKVHDIGELIKDNSYVGRGIVIGLSESGKKAVFAYFIMGRSENSRNRVFTEKGEEVTIYPFDASKVKDPSLIIYSPVRRAGNSLIVTNGDQTDTVYDFLMNGKRSKRRSKPAVSNRTRPILPRASAAFWTLRTGLSLIK